MIRLNFIFIKTKGESLKTQTGNILDSVKNFIEFSIKELKSYKEIYFSKRYNGLNKDAERVNFAFPIKKRVRD